MEFPIDFAGRQTLTLPCERVISMHAAPRMQLLSRATDGRTRRTVPFDIICLCQSADIFEIDVTCHKLRNQLYIKYCDFLD